MTIGVIVTSIIIIYGILSVLVIGLCGLKEEIKWMDIETIFLEQMKQNLLSMLSEGTFTRSQEKDLKLAKYYIENVLNTTKEDSYDYQ